MSEKKPYSAPQLFQVLLNHEQAIISTCSITATSLSDSGTANCISFGSGNAGLGCKKAPGGGEDQISDPVLLNSTVTEEFLVSTWPISKHF